MSIMDFVCPIHECPVRYDPNLQADYCDGGGVGEPHYGDFETHGLYACGICGFSAILPPGHPTVLSRQNELCGNCGQKFHFEVQKPVCANCLEEDYEANKSYLPFLHSCIVHVPGCPNAANLDPITSPDYVGWPGNPPSGGV
jgi:hypothetical protein